MKNEKSFLARHDNILPLVLVTSLFFFWGLANNMTDTLLAAFKRIMSMSEARDHLGALLKNNRAMCGTLGARELAFIFGKQAEEIGSVATVPLIHGTTFGILAIGNRDPQYYRSSMGTLFLSYIGEILNRLLPRHLPR